MALSYDAIQAAPAPVIRGNRALVPGLVNAHSHSFQRAMRARSEHRTDATADTFWTWRDAMYRVANRLSPEDVYDVARMAFLEMLLSGITTVGEFHYLHNAPDGSRYEDPNLLALQVIRAADEVGSRIVLLRSAYARAGWRQPANPLQARFFMRDVDTFFADTDRLIEANVAPIGVAPHSLRALELDVGLRIAQYARVKQLPLHMHVAEQPGEIHQCLVEHGRRPIELLHEHGLLDSSFTAVHAIHVDPQEIGYLGAARAQICACPTTERNLGDGTLPADRFFGAGARICFGSDSNVQIDLLEDARSLEYHLRMLKLERAAIPAALLFSAATSMGSAALKLPVRPDDYFTLDLDDPSLVGLAEDDLLTHIVFSAGRAAVRDVFVGGKQVVYDRRHPLQDEIVSRFKAVQRRLWD